MVSGQGQKTLPRARTLHNFPPVYQGRSSKPVLWITGETSWVSVRKAKVPAAAWRSFFTGKTLLERGITYSLSGKVREVLMAS